MSARQFNSVLLEISKELSAAQLDELKFMCRDMIGKRRLEEATSGTQLFQLLMQTRNLGADNTDCLCQFLKDIKRQDLADKLNTFESQPGFTDNQPDEAERGRSAPGDTVKHTALWTRGQRVHGKGYKLTANVAPRRGYYHQTTTSLLSLPHHHFYNFCSLPLHVLQGRRGMVATYRHRNINLRNKHNCNTTLW